MSFGRPTPYGMGYNHRIDTHQANTWPKPSPQAASRGTMTAAEAIAAAEAEGLALRTAETATGYRHVWPNPGNASKPFVAQLHGGSNGREKPHGKEKYLGIFATAEEAAFAVARHLGAKVRSIGPTYSLTAAEAHAAAAAEGLTLVKANTLTGYKGVSRRQVGSIHPHTCAYSPYQVHITRHGVSEYLGAFATVEEAALEYARKVKAEETAEPPPMTAEEAYAAAAAEGLELLRAEKNASGFKGVQRHEHNAKRPFKAVLHVLKEQEEQWHMEGRDPKKKGPLLLKHTPDDPDAPKEKPKEWHGASASSGVLGNFATAEEAALAYARALGPEYFAMRRAAAANDVQPVAEGLRLHLNYQNATGYTGVKRDGIRFQAVMRARNASGIATREGKKIYLGAVPLRRRRGGRVRARRRPRAAAGQRRRRARGGRRRPRRRPRRRAGAGGRLEMDVAAGRAAVRRPAPRVARLRRRRRRRRARRAGATAAGEVDGGRACVHVGGGGAGGGGGGESRASARRRRRGADQGREARDVRVGVPRRPPLRTDGALPRAHLGGRADEVGGLVRHRRGGGAPPRAALQAA